MWSVLPSKYDWFVTIRLWPANCALEGSSKGTLIVAFWSGLG